MRGDSLGDGHLEGIAVALDVATAALDAHAHAPHATVSEVHAVELRAPGAPRSNGSVSTRGGTASPTPKAHASAAAPSGGAASGPLSHRTLTPGCVDGARSRDSHASPPLDSPVMCHSAAR